MVERSPPRPSDPLPASEREASPRSPVSPTAMRGSESSETSPCKVSVIPLTPLEGEGDKEDEEPRNTRSLGTLSLRVCAKGLAGALQSDTSPKMPVPVVSTCSGENRPSPSPRVRPQPSAAHAVRSFLSLWPYLQLSLSYQVSRAGFTGNRC